MKRLSFLIFAIIAFFYGADALAAITATEVQALTFGNMTVTGAPPQHYTIRPDGSQTHDAGITLLPQGLPVHMWKNGMCRLAGFAPGANVTVMITAPITAQLIKGSASFDIDSFTLDMDADPDTATYVADGAGTVMVLIGATLTANASAGAYPPGSYRGTYTLDLTVNY